MTRVKTVREYVTRKLMEGDMETALKAMDHLNDDGKIVTDELGCHLKYLFNAEKTIKSCLAKSVDDDNLLSGRRVRELSFEEMDVVFAAGQQVTTGQLKATGRLISGGNDDEHA